MLRIILSAAGVALIGIGVFGGELFSSSRNAATLGSGADTQAQMQAQVQPQIQPQIQNKAQTNTQADVVTAAQVEVPAAAPAADAVTTLAATGTTSETTNQLTSQGATQAVVADATDTATNATAVVVAASAVQPVAITESENTMVVASTSAEGLPEPMAPAQAAGDLIAMAEQAKSSSRNEQVNLAKTVLTSSKAAGVENVVVDVDTKAAEVDSVIVTTTGAIENDVLIVIKDKVNLRDGPSIEHPIVLQLEQGQELMEFKREGKWVHVGAYGTSGKIGWVHQRLVGAVAK